MLKTMKKTNIKGFSLIELMVVVAIIGILAAIAVPNFQRFQRRARQAEARGLLGGLATSMEAFRSEWETYSSDLEDVGFAPSGTLRYNVGFANLVTLPAANPAFLSGAGNYSDTNGACAALPSCTGAADAIVGSVDPTATTYTAAAAGQIGGTVNLVDQWTMTHLKVFQNAVNGTF